MVKRVWAHRYSSCSIAVTVINSLIIYGALHSWFWAAPLVPHSQWAVRIAVVHASDTAAAVALAALGAAKERPQGVAMVAIAISGLAFFFFGMSMAV